MDSKHIKYIKETIRLAKVAAGHFDVPVGSVVVMNDEIIGSGENRREIDNDPSAHAEIIALRQASQKIGSWNLSGASIYVSLEPCAMCAGAIVNARIKDLYFGAYDGIAGCCGSVYNIVQDERLNHIAYIHGGILHEECAQVLKEFFNNKRKNIKIY